MIRNPGKRGRPRIKREPIAEDLNVMIDTNVTEGEKRVIIDNINEDQVVKGVVSAQTESVVSGTRSKFPHHCDWPGCERSFRR